MKEVRILQTSPATALRRSKEQRKHFPSGPFYPSGSARMFRMNKKQQFINAVEILTSVDTLILNAAQHVRGERLPQFPGATALEFVSAMQRLTRFVRRPVVESKEAKSPTIDSSAQCFSRGEVIKRCNGQYRMLQAMPDRPFYWIQGLTDSHFGV